MNVRLSCTDATFPLLPHESALRLIRGLGIRAVDVCVFAENGHVSLERVMRDPRSVAQAVHGLLAESDLEVADVFVILSKSFDELAINHPDDDVRARARRMFESVLEFAAELDAPGITILPGVRWSSESLADSIERAASELSWRAELAAARGMRLSFESHVGSVTETVIQTAELLDLAPGVFVTLDHSHFVYQGIDQGAADVLLTRTRHVQARSAAPGRLQATLRDGSIDFGRIVAALERARYDGFICLEYGWDPWLDCDKVDCVSETALLRDVLLSACRGAGGKLGPAMLDQNLGGSR